MYADKRRCLLIAGALVVFAFASCSYVEAEEKLLSENFVPDEIGEFAFTELVSFNAKNFPWEFELTKRIMREELEEFYGRFDIEIPNTKIKVNDLENFEPGDFHWSYEITRRLMKRGYPYDDCYMFGGMGFNR